MPVLARTLEASGLSTVLVTMMPYWAEKIGVPRTLAVEFPFGQTLGGAGNVAQQRRVLEAALRVLATADTPGAIVHADEEWPEATKTAVKAWQPPEPSPIIAELAPQFRQMLREHRRQKK